MTRTPSSCSGSHFNSLNIQTESDSALRGPDARISARGRRAAPQSCSHAGKFHLWQKAVDVAAGEADEQRHAAEDVAVHRYLGGACLAPTVQLVSVQLQDLGHVVAVCKTCRTHSSPRHLRIWTAQHGETNSVTHALRRRPRRQGPGQRRRSQRGCCGNRIRIRISPASRSATSCRWSASTSCASMCSMLRVRSHTVCGSHTNDQCCAHARVGNVK